MADYIYLLESRLSQAQQKALQAIRETARAKGLTVFLVGGAVRDLTSGSPVRDLDVAVQGNALKLRKDLEKAGAKVAGELEPMQALYLEFPGGVRVEIASTVAVHYVKPGRPIVKAATIQEDLRRRDFTANAMATIIVICIYVLTNLSNVVFHLRERRDEFNVLLNLVVPVLGILIFLPALLASLGIDFAGLGIGALVPPANVAPVIVVVWFVLGVAALVYFRVRAPERVQETGAVFVE